MTREDAIKVLQRMKYPYNCKARKLIISNVERENEALDMAIQALTQEPCEDTVSIRKDVLKCRVGKLVVYNVEWLKKHWQMEMDIVCGVKPCDDAISRDAVLKIIDKWYENKADIEDLIILITYMSSVTQKSETETWNGIHGQITAPKGTFKKIFDDAESEDKE